MDPVSEGEWSSLCGIGSNEEAHFMAQLLGNGPLNFEPGCGLGFGSWPAHESTVSFLGSNDSSFYPSNNFPHTSPIYSSSSGDNNDYLNLGETTNPILESENGAVLIDSGPIGEHDFPRHDIVHLKGQEEEADMKKNSSLESSRKQSRSTRNKMKRNVKLKKSQSLEFSSQNEEDDNTNNDNKNAPVYWQSSSPCCSEDDSSISQGENGGSGSSVKEPGALNQGWKTRASRGSATDPQSLYARKRRERINERLKILQSLVPNGTKVDISTMLEEAVHYVKFLQLQIKLLSSDDLWMYAPIAYNGIDIGLNLKINTPR
ncbi:hypothetical protein CRG98_007957 [Punica granatum]|nr:hypothetical protein CRG98_007957 [Punica granatum]